MAPSEIRGPDLAGVVADANEAGLDYVVTGGFAVFAHGYLRATKDSDLLVPDGAETDAAIMRFFDLIDATRFNDGKRYTAEEISSSHRLRVDSRRGVVDIIRGGRPPLATSGRSTEAAGRHACGPLVAERRPAALGGRKSGVAQAEAERVPLVTRDPAIAAHGVATIW